MAGSKSSVGGDHCRSNGVSWTFTGQQDARATKAGVSPASSFARSMSRTSVSGGVSTKVTKLQVALTSLGPNDHAERAALEVSLRKAQKQATAQTAMCIERAKKRFSNAEEWVQWAQDWRSECQRVERSRIAIAKAPCRGRGNDRRIPSTPRLGSRGQETPTASGRIAMSKAIFQSTPSVPPLCNHQPKQPRWCRNWLPCEELAERRCFQQNKHSQSGCARSIWNSGMLQRSEATFGQSQMSTVQPVSIRSEFLMHEFSSASAAKRIRSGQCWIQQIPLSEMIIQSIN